ncbi:beta-ketoacyl synthase N-terminal-like domain-containing protein, partial [Ramlibacter sp. AN1015]|uniref:beta-ketoacyl synthase N-terminal-like domain-containing protein n=1 Tax=Ramlibacter sp. AN1015 TaxID=3133428 RepID=UPI0030BADD2E
MSMSMSNANSKSARASIPVAVVGASALFPGSADKLGFWRDILAGKDLVTEVPPSHWLIDDYYDPNPSAADKVYAKRGAFLKAVDFNPMEFAIPPTTLPSTDTAQLLALLVAKQVLEDAAGSQFAKMDRSRMSVVLGVASATELVTELSARMQRPVWADALRKHGFDEAQVQAICDRISDQYVPWTENSFPGMLGNVVAGRIANRFDLAGTNCVIDAACASSLAALHLALLELESGHSDLVITGGVDTLNDPLMYACFSKTPALSPTGDCRPFSASADGTILGEGLGMLALKRLQDAERDGDRIYAVIRALGTSSDGQSKSIYAPVAAGQAKAIRRTYDTAGFGPETVELLEAHGTGTRAGDLAEFQGLARVFGDAGAQARRWCALGSVKSQIGHTKAAAGSAGLFKAVMALHHKVLPPTIKVDEPNPGLNVADSPFYLNTRARPWVRGSDHPRRASVSSFGFGGSNYHVALEEYTGAAPRRPRLRTHEHELLLVAANSASELIDRCRALDLSESVAAFTAHESLRAWQGGAHRLALVVTPQDAAATMATALNRIAMQPQQPFALPGGAVHYGVGPAVGSLGLVFSGQGSQYVDMGRDLAMSFDAARKVWDRCADLTLGPVPLHEVVFPPPVFDEGSRASQKRTLTNTEWAQPGIGAVQLAQLALLEQVGITPSAVAGHSFGEFTALAAAGSLSKGDLLRVARRRGELMAAAATVPGAMTAVMGGPQDLEQQVRACGFAVVAANRNAPSQLVFSGALSAIEQLERWLLSSSLEFKRLPVSTAFHSPLVQAAVEPLAQFLAGIDVRPPTFPVYANTTGQPYPTSAESIRRQLAQQLAAPVRFSEQVENMYAAGVRVFLEVGPRSPLSGFVEQTIGGRPCVVASLDRMGTDGVLTLCHALAKLAAAGIAMQPAELWRDYAAPSDPRLQKKPALAFPILGCNYGRPYPPAPGTNPSGAHPVPVPVSAPSSTAPHASAAAAADMEVQQWMAQLQADSQARRASQAVKTVQTVQAVQAPSQEAPAPAVSPQPAALPADTGSRTGSSALRDALLAVVSEKTGYPADMLDLSLELEAGLGIDSIKRVEILSAFRERMPGLPEVAPSQLAALNTLGDVLAFMHTDAPAPPATAPVATIAPPAAEAPASAAATTPAIDATALRQTLLAVVSEKTGYPADMLDLSLE